MHASREFVAADASQQSIVPTSLGKVASVELRQESATVSLSRSSYGPGGEEVIQWVPTGAKGDALVLGWQETVGPVDGATGGESPRVGDHDMGGQVVSLGPQAVGQPGTKDGETIEPETGVFLEGGGRMVGGFGDHRLDHRQLVGHTGEVRKQFRDPQSTFTSLSKGPVTLSQQPHFSEKDVRPFVALQRGAVQATELWFVVKTVDLAESAGGDDVHDAPNCRSRVGQLLACSGGCRFFLSEQGEQRGATDASGGEIEQIPT